MSSYMVQAMIGLKGIALEANLMSIVDIRLLAILSIAFIIAHFSPNSLEIKIKYTIPRLLLYTTSLALCIMYMTEKMEFLYFQF